MMEIDTGLNRRVEALRFDRARKRLLERLLAEPQAENLSGRQRSSLTDWVEMLWNEAEPILQADHHVMLQRYILIQMTRHKWADHPLYSSYAARMIGQPSDDWDLVDGIAAVYRNVVAARFLRIEIVQFIEREAKT
ncbi:hypothetical protein H4P12_04830 [Paracoccus sp. 11-3]|uniref:Uncharacterized protein n=1 Tax=Paracoccus amoyensis TaxID=2760093 RepID=A0A926GCZ5_9RHOB|nr:hypothetical protein [Paracoccus amoyensis]MBC9246047.1 hypothetical protein [Paracoccus amoyensis]